MTAVQSGEPVPGGIRSLEVRWIFPGPLPPAAAAWFTRFPVRLESRQDTYLLQPRLDGLAVKIRAGGALEVKAYQGSPGLAEVAGHPLGRLQYWRKWSFPCGPLTAGSSGQPGWAAVRKTRRITRFRPASGWFQAGTPAAAGQPGCGVELTEIGLGGQAWWSLGFESTGPEDRLRGDLAAAVMRVFAEPLPLPAGVDIGPGNSRSYAEWLSPGWHPEAAGTPGPLRLAGHAMVTPRCGQAWYTWR
jgi:hypothetical protein